MTRSRKTDIRLDVIGFAVIFTMLGRSVAFLGRISLVATAVALAAVMTISVTIPRIRHNRRSEQRE
jgi:hypothetical protein